MYFDPNIHGSLPVPTAGVVSVAAAVAADALTSEEPFKRTYMGHARMSSAFVFQGHKGPFRRHVHVYHDEIAYVLAGSGTVTIGDVTRGVRPGDLWVIPAGTPHTADFGDEPVHLLFISAPTEDPDHPDRIWID